MNHSETELLAAVRSCLVVLMQSAGESSVISNALLYTD